MEAELEVLGRSYFVLVCVEMIETSWHGMIPKVWIHNMCSPNKGCVTLWPCQFTLKKYLKAKEELWKLKKYYTMQKYNLQKIL
jgi:hypothetical protein